MIGDLVLLALRLIEVVIGLITTVVIINAVLSWLLAFDVVNRGNRIVDMAWTITTKLTEPLLRPIRKIVPPIGGMDLSPLILLIGLSFVVPLLGILLRPLIVGSI
jgi:YggT family protein